MENEDSQSDKDTMVLINEERQYSLWPVKRQIPAGWAHVGFTGTRAECIEYVDTIWTDLRPLSLRQKMDAAEVSGHGFQQLDT